MLVLGHTGITLGAALILQDAIPRFFQSCRKEHQEPSPRSYCVQTHPSDFTPSRFTSLGNRVDLRLLMIGSLLPDIVDKPLGQLLLRDSIGNGRIFCHTLLFLVLITAAGLYLYWNRGKPWLLVLAFGSFTHLILDQMWLTPQTLFWPLYGFAFEKMALAHWTQRILYALLTDPRVYIPEMAGAAILIQAVRPLTSKRRLRLFISTGKAA